MRSAFIRSGFCLGSAALLLVVGCGSHATPPPAGTASPSSTATEDARRTAYRAEGSTAIASLFGGSGKDSQTDQPCNDQS